MTNGGLPLLLTPVGLLRRNIQFAKARFDATPGVFAVHFLSNFSLLQQANPGCFASNS
jgi:hypothetical protein